MSDITLSKATRSNLLNLQQSAALLARTQERLATGNKVNSALDNPTNFFTASALNARASDLGMLQDSVSNAVQTLEAADNGISAITKLVESAQASARQALQSPLTVEGIGTVGSLSSVRAMDINKLKALPSNANVGAVVKTAAAMATAISGNFINADGDKIGDVTVAINGVNVTITADDTANTVQGKLASAAAQSVGTAHEFTYDKGTGTLASLVAGDTMSIKVVSAAAGTTGTIAANLPTPTAAGSAAAVLTALGANTLPGYAAGTADTASLTAAATTSMANRAAADVTVLVNDTELTITHADSADTILSKFKQAAQKSRGTNGEFTAQLNANGYLEVQAKNDRQGVQMVATKGDTLSVTALRDALGFSNTDDLQAGIVKYADTQRNDANVKNSKRKEYVDQYNELLNQIDKLAADANFNGVNLLGGPSNKLQVVFNEDGSSKLDIQPVDFSSAGAMGLDVAIDTDFDTNDGVNTYLSTIKDALDTLRAQASKFGTNLAIVKTRQDFTKNMINTLQTGAANLTLADTNEEGANMLALQTRQQLSTTALSMASQADQNVLRLFQ